ncbi:MAG TPA: hypothetical protein VNR70_11370 [Steroidobacteraceae bacterium]|nr:hypothetical protein [Steroidobacteraceae bacterium]
MTTLTTMSVHPQSVRKVSAQTVSVRTVSAPTVSLQTVSIRAVPIFRGPQKFWVQNREATLNWLALGLLLAAWNTADRGENLSARRPDALRGYSYVSVRAVQHAVAPLT